ncbi:MAG: type II secretion system protein [Elusimicrobia bacterium]|nr:type II secretion system protein [Elusimicrobiota bacterium]
MKNSRGFTLIELMVVVLIIGTLAVISVSYYGKAVETSKATESVGLAQGVGNAYRGFQIDNPNWFLSGQLSNACSAYTCAIVPRGSACRLLVCGYVAAQDWDNSPYNYFVGDSCGIGMSSCSRRNGGGSPYDTWGYNFSVSGNCTAIGNGTPACPGL